MKTLEITWMCTMKFNDVEVNLFCDCVDEPLNPKWWELKEKQVILVVREKKEDEEMGEKIRCDIMIFEFFQVNNMPNLWEWKTYETNEHFDEEF